MGGPGPSPSGKTDESCRKRRKNSYTTRTGGADTTGDIHPLPPHVVLSRTSVDLQFHIVGPLATSNELMLQQTLSAFHDAVSLLLRGQIEKRNVLESLDLVQLAADETIDDG